MLRLQLVGGMRVVLDGVTVAPPSSRRAWAVLAWLALHPGPHPRSTVAATFWPDVPEANARANLRSAVWALRRSLGPDAGTYLYVEPDRLGLRLDAPLWVDVRAVDDLVSQGRTEDAAELGFGTLLREFDDEWMLSARDAHAIRISGLLEQVAGTAQTAGDLDTAIACTRKQLELEPFSEVPMQRLMRRLAAQGDRAGALKAYARFQSLLADELGIVPAEQTRQVAEELRSLSTPGGVRRQPVARDWPLIGRTSEVARLVSAWRTARRGRLLVATITGEPGIGKTRLATELLEIARHQNDLVAAATALGLGAAAPFEVWAELIGGLTVALDALPTDAGWPEVLSPLVPALGDPRDRDRRARTRMSPELDRARLHEATVAMLDWASRGRPVVMLIDDVLAADAASLDLVGYVSRRLANAPIFIILARRPLPRRVQVDTLEHALRAQRALTTEIVLGPLDAGQVVRLTREVAELPDDKVDQVVAASDGNALLTVEWTTALARGVESPPESLRAAVRMALAPLGGDALELTRFLAVAGRSLEWDEIAGLSLPDQAGSGAAECTLVTSARERLGFRHALLRDAAYADLPDPVRRRMHARLGEVLGRGPPRTAAEAARHLQLAGQAEQAVGQFIRAAEHARAMAALPAAITMLGEALAITPADPALLLELAEVRAFLGDSGASDEAFVGAVDQLTDPAALAEAWGRRAIWYGGALCQPRLALAAARRSVELLDWAHSGAVVPRVRALAIWSWAESVTGDVEVADRVLQQIHSVLGGGRVADELVPSISHARAFALLRRGRFRESYPAQISAAEAAERLGRPDLAYGAWASAACAASCAGEFDRALEFVDHGLASVGGTGLDVLEFQLHAGRAHILSRMGRNAEASTAAAEQRRIADRLGSPELLTTADHDCGLLALRLGNYAESAALLQSALAGQASINRPLTRLYRAEALVSAGRFDEAEEELRKTALEPVRRSDMPDVLIPRMNRVQGIIARGRGDERLARRRLRESADGWRGFIARTAAGDQFVASLADFGRPPVIGLVEPQRELDRVLTELGPGGRTTRAAAPVSWSSGSAPRGRRGR